jgi:heptosyltransferase-2
MERILVIMMGGIGNMILLTPALKALRDACPSSIIVFLLGPFGAEKAVEGSKLMDKKIIVEPDKYKGLKGKMRLIREMRKENFSLSITSTGTNPLKSGLLCSLSRIKYRLGENIGGKGFFYNLKVPFDKNSHEAEANINLIQKLGIEVRDRSLYIFRTTEDKDFAQSIFTLHNLEGKFVVGMHPGSGIHQAGFKRWPKERFARLADLLSGNYDASILIFGGPEEAGLAEQIKQLMKTSPLIMAGKTTLGEAAALIEKCGLFVSNDSGLMHVACAVKTPAVGIYGPTNFYRTGPYSDQAIIIRKDLDCSPCYIGRPIHCRNMKCFNLITVEEVMGKIEKLID